MPITPIGVAMRWMRSPFGRVQSARMRASGSGDVGFVGGQDGGLMIPQRGGHRRQRRVARCLAGPGKHMRGGSAFGGGALQVLGGVGFDVHVFVLGRVLCRYWGRDSSGWLRGAALTRVTGG
jgi:hypothetical protein